MVLPGSAIDDYTVETAPEGDWYTVQIDPNEAVDADATKSVQNQYLYTGLFKAPTEKTVAAGVLTVDQNSHKIQPQSGTADDIDTISGMVENTFIILFASDAGTDTLTFKHGTGNLSCFDSQDIELSEGMVICFYNGSTIYVVGGGGLDDTKVLKAGDTMTGQLLINLGSDEKGLIIRGNASQSVNIVEVQNSGETPFFSVTSDGRTVIGGDTPVAAQALVSLIATGSLAPGFFMQNTEGDTWHASVYGVLDKFVFAVTGVANAFVLSNEAGEPSAEFYSLDATKPVLSVKGAASQSGTLQQWIDSSGNVIHTTGDGLAGSEFVINEYGADIDFRVEGDSISHLLFTDATATTENIALLAAAAPNWQTMDRGVFVGDVSNAPTGNPANGGFLYSNAGALTWRGSGGTVTVIAPA